MGPTAAAAPAASPPTPTAASAARWPGRDARLTDPAEGARRALLVGRCIIGLVTLGLLALMGRVAQLQAHAPEPVARLVDSQRSTVTFLGRRGNIEDRRGRPIATTRVVRQLYSDPYLIQDVANFSLTVADGIGYDPVEIERTLSPRIQKRYVVLDRSLDEAELARLEAMDPVPGLATEPRLVREYAQGAVAAQIIGFVNRDGQGLEGVEKMLDGDLRGEPGRIRYLRDARHRPLLVEEGGYQPPVDGPAVRLSLDLTIQAMAELELADACHKYEAESGQIIVMEPATGEILAIANFPRLDPNNFGSADAALRRNRAVTDTYEPGSTFKPFVWAMATELGFARVTERIDCTTAGVYRFPSGRRLRDASPHGLITWEEVLVFSSNIGMGIVGERMGPQALHDAVRAFGFGETTQSGLPGEVRGQLHPVKNWSGYSPTSIPMGQEIAVTPLQMARAFCVFANGGYLVTPTIRLRDAGDETAGGAILERVISPATAALTRTVMHRVVTDGTGRKANSALYAIWGKTGTAQIASAAGGGYEPDAYVSSFVCGAPLDQARVVVACVIHRPNKRIGYYGGTVAAPAARNVVEQTLAYLGVPPQPQAPPPAPARRANTPRR